MRPEGADLDVDEEAALPDVELVQPRRVFHHQPAPTPQRLRWREMTGGPEAPAESQWQGGGPQPGRTCPSSTPAARPCPCPRS
eukprot:1928640-Rhodomonas_salina.6